MSSMFKVGIIHTVHRVLDLRIILIRLLQKFDKRTTGLCAFLLVCQYLFFGKSDEIAVLFGKIQCIIVFDAVPTAGRDKMPERNNR